MAYLEGCMKGIQEYSRNYSPIFSDETEERPHLRKAVRTGRTQNFNKDKLLLGTYKDNEFKI